MAFPVPTGARNASRYMPDTSLSRNSYSYITNSLYVYSYDEIIWLTGVSCLLSGNLQTPQRKYDFILKLAFNNDVVPGCSIKWKRWYRYSLPRSKYMNMSDAIIKPRMQLVYTLHETYSYSSFIVYWVSSFLVYIFMFEQKSRKTRKRDWRCRRH